MDTEDEFFQFAFDVKGLVAPKEGIKFDDKFVFKRKSLKDIGIYNFTLPPEWLERDISDDDSIALIKAKSTGKKKIKNSDQYTETYEPSTDEMKTDLDTILKFYSLTSDKYASTSFYTSGHCITDDYPLGKLWLPIARSLGLQLDENSLKYEVEKLESAFILYKNYKLILKKKRSGYIKNALSYYYRSIEDYNKGRIYEEIIDLMISLESLLSRELGELALRISLRGAYLLSETTPPLLNNKKLINDMYKLRNRIVHGGINIKLKALDHFNIRKFKSMVRKAIILCLNYEGNKDSLIDMLDNSILQDYVSLKKLMELHSRTEESIKTILETNSHFFL